jgi:hypothetical protein
MESKTQHPPRGWSEVYRSKQTAEYSHDGRGVIVEIEPRIEGKSKRSRGGSGTSYRIQLEQDWFSKGTLGDKAVSATVATFSEALCAAYRFMDEFNEDSKEVEADHGAELEDSFGSDAAEDMLTTEASSKAFVESVGYSDSLLLEVLDEAVGDAVKLVAHRENSTPTEVYRKDGLSLPDEWPHDVFGYFGIDKGAVDTVFGDDDVDFYMIDVGELRLFRFVAGTDGETVVMLEGDAPITSPSFERSIAHIVRQRWK